MWERERERERESESRSVGERESESRSESEKGIVPSMLKVFVSQLFFLLFEESDREWEKEEEEEKVLSTKLEKSVLFKFFRGAKIFSISTFLSNCKEEEKKVR